MRLQDVLLEQIYKRYGAGVLTLRQAAEQVQEDYDEVRKQAIAGTFPAYRKNDRARWKVNAVDLVAHIHPEPTASEAPQHKPSSTRWRRKGD